VDIHPQTGEVVGGNNNGPPFVRNEQGKFAYLHTLGTTQLKWQSENQIVGNIEVTPKSWIFAGFSRPERGAPWGPPKMISTASPKYVFAGGGAWGIESGDTVFTSWGETWPGYYLVGMGDDGSAVLSPRDGAEAGSKVLIVGRGVGPREIVTGPLVTATDTVYLRHGQLTWYGPDGFHITNYTPAQRRERTAGIYVGLEQVFEWSDRRLTLRNVLSTSGRVLEDRKDAFYNPAAVRLPNGKVRSVHCLNPGETSESIVVLDGELKDGPLVDLNLPIIIEVPKPDEPKPEEPKPEEPKAPDVPKVPDVPKPETPKPTPPSHKQKLLKQALRWVWKKLLNL
jgi:hypothetical protein